MEELNYELLVGSIKLTGDVDTERRLLRGVLQGVFVLLLRIFGMMKSIELGNVLIILRMVVIVLQDQQGIQPIKIYYLVLHISVAKFKGSVNTLMRRCSAFYLCKQT